MTNTLPVREPRPKKRQQWQDLQGLVSPAILSAPRLDWDRMDRRYFQYLIRTVHGDQAPWFEHLVLLTAVLETYIGLDPSTITGRLHALHGRWRALFPAYGLTTFAEWNPEEHLPRYLQDTHFSDSLYTRDEFFRNYTGTAEHAQAYWRALPQAEQAIQQQWTLPLVPKYVTRHYARRAEIREIQKDRRKREADAITPHFSKIRGEAHLRWNQVKRLRSTFQEALALMQSGQETVPLAFSYEEPGSGQRLHFVVWDRPRLVLAHQEYYQPRTIFRAKRQIRQQNCTPFFYFLEFVKAASLPQPKSAVASDEGPFWFGDLLRYGLLRDGPFRGDPEELQRQRSYLESWGQVSEDEEMARAPLRTCTTGLLTSPRTAVQLLTEAQKHTGKLLFQVEPLFAAATFGLAAVDLLPTTGMRINELFQVSLMPACLHTLVVEGVKRLVLRLVPKGSDKLADYFVGAETQRNFEKTVQLRKEHEHLAPGDHLPSVPFDPNNGRAQRFPARAQLFQFNGRHLTDWAVTACMRLLCHGLVFQSRDGQVVSLKAQTLRHVFATHAHHIEHLPLDVDEATRQRTVSLVKAAVEHLVRHGQTVTIEAICQQSQQLDALGKGVKKAGILGNAEAYAYYRQYSTHRRAGGRKTRSLRRSASTRYPLPTALHRDLQQVRRRYLRESKQDLVERLVTVEQAYLESQQQLARLQFEILEQQHMQKRQENASL